MDDEIIISRSDVEWLAQLAQRFKNSDNGMDRNRGMWVSSTLYTLGLVDENDEVTMRRKVEAATNRIYY